MGSLALGISIRFGSKAWLHFAHETFAAVPYYLIFNPPNPVNTYPENIPDTSVYSGFGNQNFLAFGEQAVSVTNFGFGYEVMFTKRWEMLIGIRLDLNYLAPNSQYYTFQRINIESSKWHLTHGSLGFGYTSKNEKKWTVGIDYSYVAPFPFAQYVNFTDPNATTLLQGKRTNDATAQQFSLKVVLGIEIGSSKSNDKSKPEIKD